MPERYRARQIKAQEELDALLKEQADQIEKDGHSSSVTEDKIADKRWLLWNLNRWISELTGK